MIVFRPGDTWEWRTELPTLLDQRPASATLVEYLVRLFQRQQPSKAALLGMVGLTLMLRLALAKGNKPKEKDGDWEWAQVVA
jgi:hypothetical protein